jgi:pimeloyl-ACP methyl ester carboxylesterase
MPGPTVVLVHGAFADASGFAGVIRELESAGHTVLAPPNPLRGVAFDAGVVTNVVKGIDGPVVLVGHSYGGAVIGPHQDWRRTRGCTSICSPRDTCRAGASSGSPPTASFRSRNRDMSLASVGGQLPPYPAIHPGVPTPICADQGWLDRRSITGTEHL